MMTEVAMMQDMDLIDILWKQDIDLGACREVFDYNHRQKEHELQRQRELEEEKRLHLLREQEKALLAQLQLDEETGEYIPRAQPGAQLQLPIPPLENVSFTDESSDQAMFFDDYLELLAETFPVAEVENIPVSLDTTLAVPSSSNILMSPEQMPLPPDSLTPGPLPPPLTPLPAPRMSPDLEQAWMELLSLPELQQCLNMQMEDTLETNSYPLPNNPEVQNPNFYAMANIPEGEINSSVVCPEFIGTFDGSVSSMSPPNNFVQMDSETPQLNSNFSSENICDIFYPPVSLEGSSSQQGLEGNQSPTTSEISNKSSFTHMELYSLSPGESFDSGNSNPGSEMPDSDSGLSSNTSRNSSSPTKSAYGDGSFGYSDSDMEELDHNPGSAESDYSEMFSLNFQPDDLDTPLSISTSVGQPQQQNKEPKQYQMELAEENGHSNAPFTKDKNKKRFYVRLPRDEQRAKALKIPMSVDMIINLPVDDFNEMMSKHQLNDAQLALVRDIRRRGKNKVAAQNCRKRKMENILGLEGELDSLKDEKERLLSEKRQNATSLKEMKQQLNSLYLEVFSMLRDEQGNSYSPSEYSLQQSTNGSIFLVPRIKKTLKSKDNHLH
ncbi:nuclear factor erythroid 2-related factor 2a isoform X2 [Cynoglossus semilaevis]|uniref:nuclear factor erythroid 2-related factor 2a isoform X2 n=1 Tax=Cynoglossus semilaevis TaxID=244447 RepID=UPI0004954957|nr:nuclear factor erythroid 2-related factor 2 isoform X2 [Cynoglossus semilaevis]